MSQHQPLPSDVRDALLRIAKSLVLSYCVGGMRRLEPWDDNRAYRANIYSWNLGGTQAQNLRRLVRLAGNGVLIERQQLRKGGIRTFTAPRSVLDDIGAQAVREWEAIGYVVGVMTPEIRKQSHD